MTISLELWSLILESVSEKDSVILEMFFEDPTQITEQDVIDALKRIAGTV